MQPALQHTVQQPAQPQQIPMQPSRAYGPGQRGAKQSADLQNFGAQVSNLANQINFKMQERKAREQQGWFDKFAGAYQGIYAAQAQMQEAQQALVQARQMPDSPEKSQAIQAASQRYAQAKQSATQNKALLDDIADDKKKMKVLLKGYGIDDKNAQKPERQQAIQSIRKATGLGANAAQIVSGVPSTQQISPQALEAQAGRQMGGTPMTQNQRWIALEKLMDMQRKEGESETNWEFRGIQKGLKLVSDPSTGRKHFDPMTPEEKGIFQATTTGKLVWIKGQDGNIYSMLRDPKTNQLIPGTENRSMIPPNYLLPHISDKEFSWFDAEGYLHRTPTESRYQAVIPGAQQRGRFTGGAGPSVSSTQQQPRAGAPAVPSPAKTAPASSTPAAPALGNLIKADPAPQTGRDRIIGKTYDPEPNAEKLVDNKMVPSQLPGMGKARDLTLKRAAVIAKERGIDYDPERQQRQWNYANSIPTQNVLKYLDSLTGRDNKSGNLEAVMKLSDTITRTDMPAANAVELWAKLAFGDPKTAAYQAALLEVSDQIAKIMQGGGSGGGTSDAKIRQASEIMNKNYSQEQIRTIGSTVRTLLANRKAALIGDNPFLLKDFGLQAEKGKSVGGFEQREGSSDYWETEHREQ
jgi:hypothetical protein